MAGFGGTGPDISDSFGTSEYGDVDENEVNGVDVPLVVRPISIESTIIRPIINPTFIAHDDEVLIIVRE